jgi:hypothetical protein
MTASPYFIPTIAANLVALVLFIAAVFWPRLVRWGYVVLFVSASLVNGYLALQRPALYVQSYGETAAISIYRAFINGYFATHAETILLAVTAGQLLVALLLTRTGVFFWLGVVGACIFLLAIAPLGFGSAFPAPLILAAALFMTAFNLSKMEVV